MRRLFRVSLYSHCHLHPYIHDLHRTILQPDVLVRGTKWVFQALQTDGAKFSVVYGAHGDDASTCGDDGDGGFAKPGDASSCVGDDSDDDGFTVKCCSGNLPQSSSEDLAKVSGKTLTSVADCGKRAWLDVTQQSPSEAFANPPVPEAIMHMTRLQSMASFVPTASKFRGFVDKAWLFEAGTFA